MVLQSIENQKENRWGEKRENITLKFRLDQRSFDVPTSSSMLPVMETLALYLSCNLKTYRIKTKSTSTEVLSVSVTSIAKIESIINYFNQYPLLGGCCFYLLVFTFW